MVTGKASKKEDKKDHVMGLFYQLPQELQYAVIMCGKIHADETRKNFTEALRQQAIAREEKAKFARDKKLKAAEKQLIGASYLYQQYDMSLANHILLSYYLVWCCHRHRSSRWFLHHLSSM